MTDPAAPTTRRDIPGEGAWSEYGEAWFPASLYTRDKARSVFANECGCHWIDVRVRVAHLRWAPDDPMAAAYDGDYWTVCGKDHPDAFKGWWCS